MDKLLRLHLFRANQDSEYLQNDIFIIILL